MAEGVIISSEEFQAQFFCFCFCFVVFFERIFSEQHLRNVCDCRYLRSRRQKYDRCVSVPENTYCESRILRMLISCLLCLLLKFLPKPLCKFIALLKIKQFHPLQSAADNVNCIYLTHQLLKPILCHWTLSTLYVERLIYYKTWFFDFSRGNVKTNHLRKVGYQVLEFTSSDCHYFKQGI